jgi:probable O-glycosylation ligase (exosortase A-associated)
MNPHRFTYDWAYNYPFSQVVAIATLVGFVVSRDPKRFPWSPVTVVWILFILWMNVSTLFALNPEAAAPEWERAMKIQLIAFVTLLVITTRERLYLLVWAIVLSLGFFGAKGGLFSIATGGQYLVMGPRASFIAENNTLALALIMTLPLMWYLYLETSNRLLRWGLLGLIALTALSIVTSHSRGALLAGGAMVVFLWLKSPHKLRTALLLVALVPAILMFMPEKWFERMETIQTFQEDASALGRINAWSFAYNVASDRPITGGGYNVFSPDLFKRYAPDPDDFHDAHSIYFEVLGEHGFVGLGLYLVLGFLAFRLGNRIIQIASDRPDLRWAKNQAAMLQASIMGYAVGGAFLGLAYFDLYYHLLGMMVITNVIVTRTLALPDAPVAAVAARNLEAEGRTSL